MTVLEPHVRLIEDLCCACLYVVPGYQVSLRYGDCEQYWALVQ